MALEARGLTVEWRGASGTWRSEVGREHAGSLGYGYATTVPYLRSCDAERESLVVLGDPTELASVGGRGRARDAGCRAGRDRGEAPGRAY